MNKVERLSLEEIEKTIKLTCNSAFTPQEYAEALYNAGYHRTIWRKVSDGDLPEYAGSYLVVCGDESLPEYDVDFYENFWNGKRWVHNEGRIIAWTEIPKYE